MFLIAKSMSNSNPVNLSKNNVTEGQYRNLSEPLSCFETLNKNATAKNCNSKSAAGTSFNTDKKVEEPVTPGTEVHASSLFDDSNFEHYHEHSYDTSAALNQGGNVFNLSGHLSKYCVSDEVDKAIFNNKVKIPVTLLKPDAGCKSIVSKQNLPSDCKNRNSSNFSIFGQLLNKKQNTSITSKGSGSSNNYLFPQNVRQSSSAHSSTNEVSEHSDGVQRAQMKTKLKSMWNNVKYGNSFVIIMHLLHA